jgi:hypothetical protein
MAGFWAVDVADSEAGSVTGGDIANDERKTMSRMHDLYSLSTQR